MARRDATASAVETRSITSWSPWTRTSIARLCRRLPVRPADINQLAEDLVASASAGGIAGQDLGVSKWDACVEGIGDGGVPQGVRADVVRDAGDLRDSGDHPVGVAAVDRIA